jgi:ABC-type transport system substrate-binding protein
VYRKNPDYKPRSEPADGFAGGKAAKVDRVEWLVIPDANTAVQALIKGEVDIIEIPQTDLPAAHPQGSEHYRQGDRSRRHAGGLPDEPSDSTVQQREGAAGTPVCNWRPEGLPRVDDRLRRLREALLGGVHLRYAVRDASRRRRLGEGRQEGERRERRRRS